MPPISTLCLHSAHFLTPLSACALVKSPNSMNCHHETGFNTRFVVAVISSSSSSLSDLWTCLNDRKVNFGNGLMRKFERVWDQQRKKKLEQKTFLTPLTDDPRRRRMWEENIICTYAKKTSNDDLCTFLEILLKIKQHFKICDAIG